MDTRRDAVHPLDCNLETQAVDIEYLCQTALSDLPPSSSGTQLIHHLHPLRGDAVRVHPASCDGNTINFQNINKSSYEFPPPL